MAAGEEVGAETDIGVAEGVSITVGVGICNSSLSNFDLDFDMVQIANVPKDGHVAV